MWWILLALTLRRVAPHSKKKSENIALNVALRFLRLFPILGRGVIADCKDPSLQECILQLNNKPHTPGYTMKVEQRRPRLKPAEIYALAHKSVSEKEALERLNKGDKTTVMYTHCPSHNRTAVNAVNADATTDPNTSEPADTSVNAVGHPKPPAKKTVDPMPKPPPTFRVPCSKQWKSCKQTEMDMSWIDWGATNSTIWTCKPNS